MSLFADYCREKGMLIVELPKGFMSAYVHGDACMVDNFYVESSARGGSTALRLTLEIIRQAKEKGCTVFCAEIYKADPLYAYILRLHKHFGMEPVEDTEYKTVTAKDISGELYVRQSRAIAAH